LDKASGATHQGTPSDQSVPLRHSRLPARYPLSLAPALGTALLMAPRLSGRLHRGCIAGVTNLLSDDASSLGPLPMGLARDLMGSYGAACGSIDTLFGTRSITRRKTQT